MKVYLITSQVEIGYILCEEIRKTGHFCIFYSDLEAFFLGMKNSIEYPDLIVADYLIYNHDSFNLYTALLSDDIYTPVIFYNDPCITRSNRANHWWGHIKECLAFNEETSPSYKLFKKNEKSYKSFFEKLADIVESDDLSQYIPLMQKPKPIPEEFKKSLRERLKEFSYDSMIESFRKRVKLPQNLYNTLRIFIENKGNPISISKLSEIYSRRFTKISVDSTRVNISRLKNYIEKDPNCILTLVKKKNGYELK